MLWVPSVVVTAVAVAAVAAAGVTEKSGDTTTTAAAERAAVAIRRSRKDEMGIPTLCVRRPGSGVRPFGHTFTCWPRTCPNLGQDVALEPCCSLLESAAVGAGREVLPAAVGHDESDV